MAQLHVIFGAGQVGEPLARRLLAAGHRVRVVRRSSTPLGDGIEVVAGTADDAAFVTAQVAGATAAYHCMNPPYDSATWADVLPRWADHLVEAARRSGARLVVLDNVYGLGAPTSGPLSEATPPRPRSTKGRVRAAVTERLLAAHSRGDAAVVIGRASDFWGPGGTLTYFGDQYWPAALSGRPVRWPGASGSLDTPHTYHYTLDVAAGLAALGTAEADVAGQAWMLPCLPARSTRAMSEALAAAGGLAIRLAPTPGWLLGAMAMVVPIMRELREMGYQWEMPFEIDDRRFRARFPAVAPTPFDDAVCATVAWARAHYGRATMRVSGA